MIINPSPIIKINNLHKYYEDVHAVKGVNFEVQQGEIFGIIGPDGAGKTTIFKILSGVMKYSEGDISILGYDIQESRKEIGYLTQQFSFYNDLTVEENLKYSAGLRKIPKNIFNERKNKYLKLMGIERFTDRLGGQLSGGMRQKLALCSVLVFQPKILLLDEPTTGVDPISRREFWDVLTALSNENVTIIVATPYLDEAERCNRIALIHDGQFEQIGTPKDLKERSGFKRLEIITADIGKTENILLNESYKEDSEIKDVQTFGDRLDVLVKDIEIGKDKVTNILSLNNIPLTRIIPADITLENAFVNRLRQKGSVQKFIPFPYQKPPLITNQESNNYKKKTAIKASRLNKIFGDFQAVNNLDLEVKYGEIYGLLGANGAGKTTTIKMLCGLIDATSGTICLAGNYENLKSSSVRQKIGYMSQKFTLYDDLTILENLKFYCGVYNVPPELQYSKIKWVLDISGLAGQENLLTGSLPGGWKQRVSFGASIMHEPEILFLDEPTSGVDPLARRQFWKLIENIARHGTAIIVTTHYMEEAEHCNKIAFMSGGEIVIEGSPGSIKSSQKGFLQEIAIDKPQKANFILKRKLEHWKVSLFGDKLHVILDNPELEMPFIYSALETNQIKILSAKQIPFSLEDSFISIIERANNRVNHK